jgi:hypothetical protein
MPILVSGPLTELVVWQICASEDNTQVVLTAPPGVSGLPASPFVLDRGEVQEMEVSGTTDAPGDFLIQADKPVGVLQYMKGSSFLDGGDPSMAYLSPSEQFLPRYVVLVPPTWDYDVLVITRLSGTAVLLDGAVLPDSQFNAVGSTGYEVARRSVADGVHVVASQNGSDGLGLMVVGWDNSDSYAYTGGMGMAAINPIVD